MKVYSIHSIILLFLLLVFNFKDNSNQTEIKDIKPITDAEAINLTQLAGRYYEVVNGGNGFYDGRKCNNDTININNNVYVYYCGFDSTIEIFDYLAEVFTPEYTLNFMDAVKLKEYSGEIIMLGLGTGNILNWSEATILSRKTIDEDEITYIFGVPDPDDTIWNETVNYKYVKNVGWRLAHKL